MSLNEIIKAVKAMLEGIRTSEREEHAKIYEAIRNGNIADANFHLGKLNALKDARYELEAME